MATPNNEERIEHGGRPRLPAPFDDIGFAWNASSAGITLEYTGEASRLIECGAIEPDMAGKAKVKTRPRVDSHGHYFNRDLRIIRKPLREELIIWRLITDQKFAETLPGFPRGLRFKFFDWFDANPGKPHITTEKKTGPGGEDTRTCITGTIDHLIAAGFRRSAFEKRFTICGRQLGLWRQGDVGERDVDPAKIQCQYASIMPLMRGYFEITMYSKDEVAPVVQNDQKQPRTKHVGGPALRLVVNNKGDGPWLKSHPSART